MDEVNATFANGDEILLDVKVVEKWEIDNQREIGDTIFFSSNGLYFSMKTIDYNKIFNNEHN